MSVCSCICRENPAFFLLECLPPHSHHHDHNRILVGEWRAETKRFFIFQQWQEPHQGDIWMRGWKKRYLNPQRPRCPFRNRGLGGQRAHWLKSRTDTLPWHWEDQMSSEGPKEGFPAGPVVKTLLLHCSGCELDSWLEDEDPTCHVVWPKSNKNYFKNIKDQRMDLPSRRKLWRMDNCCLVSVAFAAAGGSVVKNPPAI